MTLMDSNKKEYYAVLVATDGFHASREPRRWHYTLRPSKATAKIECFDTLKEANARLLGMFNDDNNTRYTNFGLPIAHNYDVHHFTDGTYSYGKDIYDYFTKKLDVQVMRDYLRQYGEDYLSGLSCEGEHMALENYLEFSVSLEEFCHMLDNLEENEPISEEILDATIHSILNY